MKVEYIFISTISVSAYLKSITNYPLGKSFNPKPSSFILTLNGDDWEHKRKKEKQRKETIQQQFFDMILSRAIFMPPMNTTRLGSMEEHPPLN